MQQLHGIDNQAHMKPWAVSKFKLSSLYCWKPAESGVSFGCKAEEAEIATSSASAPAKSDVKQWIWWKTVWWTWILTIKNHWIMVNTMFHFDWYILIQQILILQSDESKKIQKNVQNSVECFASPSG